MTASATCNLSSLLTYGIALFSIAAGGAWLRAATAKVHASKNHSLGKGLTIFADDDGSYEIIADGIDVARTLSLQSKWNTRAAALTCAAALCQALEALPGLKL